MNTETFLKKHGACADGADFARKHKTLAEAWDACERPDWLLWAYQRKVPASDDKQLRLFACWCARQNWDKLTDVRSRRAIEVAEAFANGLATEEELETARKDASASAAYAAAAVASAAYAAAPSAASAAAVASVASAASAASVAAVAAVASAAYAAYVAYVAVARKAQATKLKTMISNPFV